MNNRDRFISICRALWGEEWYPSARKNLGVSIRTIKYWAAGTHEPKDWDRVFLSLLGCCDYALGIILARKAAIVDFKRSYKPPRGR